MISIQSLQPTVADAGLAKLIVSERGRRR